jgi:diamine N-acetyltransferase
MNIEGKISRLRALEPSDVEVLYRWENDLTLWRVSGALAPFSRHTLLRLIEEQQFDIYATRQQRFIIEDLAGEIVGAIDLLEFDPQNLRAGVGIIIEESARRQGYAKDALAAIERYAKDVLHLHQLWCGVTAGNKASEALFRSAGYKQAGLRKEWTLIASEWYDELIFQKFLQ